MTATPALTSTFGTTDTTNDVDAPALVASKSRSASTVCHASMNVNGELSPSAYLMAVPTPPPPPPAIAISTLLVPAL